MDYKLLPSNMKDKMELRNFKILGKNNTIKFVFGNMNNLEGVKQGIDIYKYNQKSNILLARYLEQLIYIKS